MCAPGQEAGSKYVCQHPQASDELTPAGRAPVWRGEYIGKTEKQPGGVRYASKRRTLRVSYNPAEQPKVNNMQNDSETI